MVRRRSTVRFRKGAPPAASSRGRHAVTVALALLSAALVAAVLLPWVHADPAPGVTRSDATYTDEGLYGQPGRNLVLFGRTGTDQFDLGLTDGGYAAATAALDEVRGVSIVNGRLLSVASVALAVGVLVGGLAAPLGLGTALLAAAALAGNQLTLLYGRVAFVEPFVVLWAVVGFVLMTHATRRRSWGWGAASGVALALAAWAKPDGLLPVPAVVGVPLLSALLARSRERLRAPLAALGVLGAGVAAWGLAVALPNRARLDRTLSAQVQATVPVHSALAAVHRVSAYFGGGSDHALRLTAGLLAASVAGVVVVAGAVVARSARRREVETALVGVVWAGVAWGAVILRGYSPNRYVVVVVPGLALAAAAGLGCLARLPTARPHWDRVQPVLAGLLALLLLAGGVVPFWQRMSRLAGTHQLADDQRAVAAVLPAHAVVYGVFGPVMCFGTDARTVTPWPASGVNMTDPVRTLGVGYAVFDQRQLGQPLIRREVLAVTGGAGLGTAHVVLRLSWGPHRLVLYQLRRRS